MNFIEKEWKALKATHAGLNREFFLVMLIELVYAFALFSFSNAQPLIERWGSREIEGIIWDKARVISEPGVLDANLAMWQTLVVKVSLIVLGFIVLHSVLYSLFNYFSWSRMADKHFDLQHAKGFVRISAVWIFLWILLFIGLLAIFDIATWGFIIAFGLCVMLFLHMTTMMNIVLIHNKSNNTFKKVFVKTLKLSVHKLPHCFPPVTSGVVVVVLGGMALSLLTYLLPNLRLYLKEIYLFYFIAFITWWRTHLYNVLKVHAHRV